MSAKRPHGGKLSAFEAWALALGGIVGWGSFVMPGTVFLPAAGPLGSAIAFAIAAAIMVVIALNFHFMMNRDASTGGAFVYARNAFGHTHGYLCGWFLILAYLAIVPQNATALALISRDLMGGILEAGPSYNLAGYDTYLVEMVLVIVVLGLVTAIAMRSTKALGVLQAVFAVCIVVGVAIIAIGVWGSPQASAANLQPAFAPGTPPLAGIVAILTVAPWAFIGFDAISQIGQDISFEVRRVGGIMVGAIVAGAAVYITLNLSSIVVLPAGYDSWSAYIADLPNLDGLQGMPVFDAVLITMGLPGRVVLDVAVSGAIFSGIVGFTLAVSRLIFAMSRAGAISSWFGKEHPVHGTPLNALITVLVASLALACMGRAVLGWITDMSSVGVGIAFLYTSLAVARQARLEGKGAWRAAGLVGTVASAAFVVFLLVPIPMTGNMLDLGSYVLLITWVVLGVNFYTPEYRSGTAIANMPDDFEVEDGE